MSVVNGYVDELDSFVDEVIEWRAEASSESSEVGADVVSVTAVNFLDYTLDVVEAAGKLLEADRDDKGLEVVEDVVQEYNEARFSQMTTWYEHRTAVQNVESNMKDSGDYHLFAEEIQENIWDAMDIT